MIRPFARRNPIAAYFLLTFLISWAAALAVVARSFFSGQLIPKTLGLLVFPAMLLGPSVSGILLTALIDGRAGLRDLLSRICKWKVAPHWYAVLLIPPVLVLATLFLLRLTISGRFSPNNFYIGILFGIPAGIFEEIGWTGFAYPRMASHWGVLKSAIVLGILWSLWHLPAVNFLGASAPHGPNWLPFFLAFGFAMTAMRVLICWQYSGTKSVLLAQLMHISSTGALVVFSPPVSSARETLWYAVYGCALWLIVVLVVRIAGTGFSVPAQSE
jgi:CAAX protease family protein